MATVLITGTSTGIGLATALAFGKAGHRVAATMRNPARAPELASLAAQDKLAITVYPMDVDLDASVSEAIGRIGRELGPIDVLVNNAGIERMGSVEELPLADFRRHGDQLLWNHPLRSGRSARNATTAQRLHHQCGLHRRAHRRFTAGRLLVVQIRGGGPE